MADTKEQVLSFLNKCEELKSCKFIMATTKIKDLLKCIVNCPDLYRLFEAVTKDFDYPAERERCLISSNDGLLERNYVVLPKTIGKRLAFIFCLLVDFDRDTVNLNDFLRKYFSDDGSYYASYRAFCNTIIKSLQECVEQVFYEELSSVANVANPDVSELLSAFNIALAGEMQFVSRCALPEEDKENGLKILSALSESVKEGNEAWTDALVCGYNYFVLYNNCISDGITELIKLIEACEKAV